MNWVSLISELENLIFWLASLIVLAPKTLYKIIRSPKLMIAVLDDEIRKQPDERYDMYVSPVMFWVIFSIFAIILHTIFQEWIGFLVGGAVGGGSTDIKDFDYDFGSYRITKAIVISIWFPLVFSCIALFRKGTQVTKKNLEPNFYMQCYGFGSFVALYTILSIIVTFISFFLPLSFTPYLSLVSSSGVPISWLAISVALIWLLYFEMQLFRIKSITLTRKSSFLLIMLSMIVAAALSSLTIWLFIGLFQTAL